MFPSQKTVGKILCRTLSARHVVKGDLCSHRSKTDGGTASFPDVPTALPLAVSSVTWKESLLFAIPLNEIK